MFRFNGSLCRCRGEQTPLNWGNKRSHFFNRDILQQNFSGPKKRGNVSPCNRAESSQEVCGLPFSNGKCFLSQNSSQQGRHYDIYRLKGCLSVRSRTQIAVEKQNMNLLRSAICAKYSSQSLCKANKAHSCLPTEERYSNNRLPRRLCNPRFLHRRVKGKHLASTDPFAAHGFTINWEKSILDPMQSLTFLGFVIDSDNVTQPSRTKGPEYTEQMSRPSLPNSSSSRSSQPNRDIEVCSPCYLASTPPLQISTNAARKVPSGFSRQLRDTVPLNSNAQAELK